MRLIFSIQPPNRIKHLRIYLPFLLVSNYDALLFYHEYPYIFCSSDTTLTANVDTTTDRANGGLSTIRSPAFSTNQEPDMATTTNEIAAFTTFQDQGDVTTNEIEASPRSSTVDTFFPSRISSSTQRVNFRYLYLFYSFSSHSGVNRVIRILQTPPEIF